jgi:hypothetical protein
MSRRVTEQESVAERIRLGGRDRLVDSMRQAGRQGVDHEQIELCIREVFPEITLEELIGAWREGARRDLAEADALERFFKSRTQGSGQ